DSLRAYRAGDLLQALKNYPDGREPGSEAEWIYYAGLLLAAGQVNQAQAELDHVKSVSGPANALHEIIAVVKGHPPEQLSAPGSASEAVARSYDLQSRSQLSAALDMARLATTKSPNFGAAWVRVADLEFSFGHTTVALAALKHG